MKISACLIVRNEERDLPRCVNSFRELVDEIIVVDSGSTDRTMELARSLGAKVFSHEWQGYVIQKNHALSLASHPWILSVDGDEELSPELQQSIKKLRAENKSDDVAGYEINRLVRYRDRWIRHGDWYPDRLVRLFQKSRAQFAGAKVHERLEVDGEIQFLGGDLYHYTYQDQADRARRIERYAALWAEGAKERGVRTSFYSSWLHAGWRLFRGYVLKSGWRDGSLGWEIAWGNAREVYLKYHLLAKLHSENGS